MARASRLRARLSVSVPPAAPTDNATVDGGTQVPWQTRLPLPPVRRRGFDAKLGPMETHRKASVRLAADPASSRQGQDSLRIQLRAQAVDIDRLEAENAEQRDAIRNLRTDLARLQSIQQTDSHDLVHLAGRLLAVSHATGVELHSSTKALFRRRGWTATKRNPETQSQ